MSASSYLLFEEVPAPGRKTTVVRVVSRRRGDTLGRIMWHGAWRQYAFFPEPGTIWNPQCLDEVNAHTRGLMALRRRNLRRAA